MIICEGKRLYTTKNEARQAKKLHRKKYGYAKFYYCNDCNGWHTTTTRHNLEKQFKDIDFQHQAIQLIQSQSKKAEFLRRLSNQRTMYRIFLDGRGYIVTYNRRRKLCEINNYIGKSNKRQQAEFSDIDAQAILSMVPPLINDGYSVEIKPVNLLPTNNDEMILSYKVIAKRPDSESCYVGESWTLSYALAIVYQQVPIEKDK